MEKMPVFINFDENIINENDRITKNHRYRVSLEDKYIIVFEKISNEWHKIFRGPRGMAHRVIAYKSMGVIIVDDYARSVPVGFASDTHITRNY